MVGIGQDLRSFEEHGRTVALSHSGPNGILTNSPSLGLLLNMFFGSEVAGIPGKGGEATLDMRVKVYELKYAVALPTFRK